MSLIVLLFYFVLIGYSYANNEGECAIDTISNGDWLSFKPLSINDGQRNEKILVSAYTGDLEFIEDCSQQYFKIYTEDSNFIIETTDEFNNFDLNTEKSTTSKTLDVFGCRLKCVSESLLQIIVTVDDYNNHPPTFKNSTPLEYSVASPIMPNTDFSVYGDPIVVEDLDFRNLDVVFSIEPDDFSITSLSSSTTKEYTAVFRARRIIQIDGSKQYTITATDTGTNPGTLTTSQVVTLTTDPSSSFDTPAFQTSSNSYSFKYTAEGGSCSLNPIDDPITLTTNKPGEISEHLTISGDLKDHFEAVFDEATKTISISCLSPVVTTSSVAVLLLSVTTDSMATVPIVLYLEDVPADVVPEFKSQVYTADYDDRNERGYLKASIEVTPTTATVEISEGTLTDFAKYFALVKVSDNYEVEIAEALPPDILQSQRSVVLTITASLGGATSSTVLIINLPATAQSSSVEFAQVLYSGLYQVVEGNVDFTHDTIGIVTDEEDSNILVSISENSPYTTYFNVSYASKVLTVNKRVDLPENILKNNTIIPLTLEASVSGTESETSASAVLNIRIDYDANEEDTRHLNFNKMLYEGTYATQNNSLEVTDEIIIDTDETDDNIEISIDNDYSQYFSATYSQKRVTVELVTSLPNATLQSVTVIPLVLLGRIKSTVHTSRAVLNLQIIDDGNSAELSLKSFVYNGKYHSDGTTVTIEHDNIVVQTNQEEERLQIEITNGYGEDFIATYSNNQVLVTPLRESPSETLLSLANIPVGIRMQIKDTSIEAQAVLNLRVVDDSSDKNDTKTLAFSRLLYSGNYSVKDGEDKGHFEIEELQLRTNLMEDEIEITLSNEYGYDRYFDVSNNDRIVSVQIHGGSLSEEIVKHNTLIPLTLNAKIIETGDISSAILNIRIEYTTSEEETHEHTVTGYIVAIAILAILLLLLIGGTIGFYLWKIKSRTHEKFDDAEHKVTFEQRPSQSINDIKRKGSSSALEGRRPTGFVYRKFDENGDEIGEDSIGEAPMERRKSVAFDDKIEKLQIDSIDDEDIDKALDDTENTNDTSSEKKD